MRYFVFIFLLFATEIESGPFHDHVKHNSSISESKLAEEFVNGLLEREEIHVNECYEILADVREYLIVGEEFDLQGLAMLIKFRSEVVDLLEELSKLPRFMKSLLDENDLFTRVKVFFANLLPYLNKQEFKLADHINLDESFHKKFIEAFRTWLFIKTHEREHKLALVTQLYKATFTRYVSAFIDEVDELMSLPLHEIPLDMYKSRLTRIRTLLLSELALMQNYSEYELNIQMLIRQLKAYILYRENQAGKPLHDVKVTLGSIKTLLQKVLNDIPKQKIKLA